MVKSICCSDTSTQEFGSPSWERLRKPVSPALEGCCGVRHRWRADEDGWLPSPGSRRDPVLRQWEWGRTSDILVPFSVAVIKYPNKRVYPRLYVVPNLSLQSISVGKPRLQKHGTASHMTSIVKSRSQLISAGMLELSLLSHLFCSPGTPGGGLHVTHSGWSSHLNQYSQDNHPKHVCRPTWSSTIPLWDSLGRWF